MGRIKSNQGHWKGAKADPYHYLGFIYIISDDTINRHYIGKKQYWLRRGRIKGCRRVVTDKQSNKFSMRCWKESDWRTYKGSSPSLCKHMRKYPDNKYDFRILYQCRSKGELHYMELKELWSRDVIAKQNDEGGYEYFNRSIGAIKFRPPIYEE